MKPILIAILVFYSLLVSCYKPYEPGIEANDTILVVDGLITNKTAVYHVNLSYASPFDSRVSGKAERSATVYVTDDKGNIYPFANAGRGEYISDSLQFTGQPGRSYTLYIETVDGEIYMSDPQQICREYQPDTIYTELNYIETLSRFNTLIKTVQGANILVDIKTLSDTLPRFRFSSQFVLLYYYSLLIPPPYFDPPEYSFYCWRTDDLNPDINLAHNEYSKYASTIEKHTLYFIDDQIYVKGDVYNKGPRQPDFSFMAIATGSHQIYPISQRILYIDQYSLNDAAYLYYKRMDEQLRGEGKLFDPIAVQLIGNIKCTTNADKKVLGFFEASSVSHSLYKIGFRQAGKDNYFIKRLTYFPLPSSSGCWIDKVPPFWAK